MKKGQKMPEWLRKKRIEYMKLHPLRYWQGKKRPNLFSEKWKKEQSKRLKGHWVSPKTVKHIKNFNKGKFGKNHPCYKKSKKHPFHKSIRECYKYRQWRSNVFKRDNFKCILCGEKGYVEADHYPIRFIEIIRKYSIKTFDQAIKCKELWDINNGRTLCKKCHLANYQRK